MPCELQRGLCVDFHKSNPSPGRSERRFVRQIPTIRPACSPRSPVHTPSNEAERLATHASAALRRFLSPGSHRALIPLAPLPPPDSSPPSGRRRTCAQTAVYSQSSLLTNSASSHNFADVVAGSELCRSTVDTVRPDYLVVNSGCNGT